MVRKTVNDLARSCDDAPFGGSARDDQSSGAFPEKGSVESGSRNASKDEVTATCPRCKRATSAASSECAACGFSSRETCVSPAGASPDPVESEAVQDFDRGSLIGETIAGKYRVLGVLGEGGFGVVYKVEFLLFDERQIFALKLLHPRLSSSADFRRRFHREARLAMSFAHESAIQVREFGRTEDGLLYYTMDYCDGESLKDLLARESILSVSRSLSLTRELLAVVHVAHEHGIVHRDLKPENIFVVRDLRGRERIKVGDFGLAKTIPVRRRSIDEITHGGIVGSPRYMSPEQARGADVDARSDLFSIGLVVFEMLYGTVPWSRNSDSGTSSGSREPAERRFEFERPRDDRVPDEVYMVISRALASEIEERYETAEDFRRALDAAVAPKPRGRRGRLVSVAASLLILLCAFYFTPLAELVRPQTARDGARTGQPAARMPATTAAPSVAIADEIKTLRIEEYAALRAGDVIDYEIHVAPSSEQRAAPLHQALGQPRRLRLSVEEEARRGRFRVRVSPGGHGYFLVLDRAANTLSREFSLPNSETGELEPAEPRVLLRLPGTSAGGGQGYRTSVGGREIDVVVNTGAADFEVLGRTFRDCVEVVESDPVSGTKTVRYYQRGRGEVATQSFEAGRDTPYFSRVIAD